MASFGVFKLLGFIQPIKDEELPMKFYVPYCVMLPTLSPATGTDGFGNTVDGYAEPLFDTLFGICNPTSEVMDVEVATFNADGTPKPWLTTLTKKFSLASKHGIAFTFIRPNPFTDAPQNFEGYAIVSLSRPGAVNCLLGGGGYFPNYWGTFSAEVPVFADQKLNGMDVNLLSARSSFTYPYSIPYFDDLNHHLARSYRTSLVLTNFDKQDCWAHISFIVDDFYSAFGGAGTKFSTKKQLLAGRSIKGILYDWLQEGGYPPNQNYEGWIQVDLRSGSDESSPIVALSVLPYMLVSDRDFQYFSAATRFF